MFAADSQKLLCVKINGMSIFCLARVSCVLPLPGGENKGFCPGYKNNISFLASVCYDGDKICAEHCVGSDWEESR